MSVSETLYEALLMAARPAARVAALFGGRTRRGVRGRDETLRRFEAWSAADRDPDRPLVWLHAPSVGEALMAKAIIAALREELPGAQFAFTHFSPSAERMADSVGADVWGYLPWDTRGPLRRALAALRPAALVFVRTEVWPLAAREAQRSGAAVLLVNAVLAEGSSRLRALSRGVMEAVYRRLDAVGAVSADHAARYERLGVPASAIEVTGDARFDQVWRRVQAGPSEEAAGLVAALADPDAFQVVAGSTWPSDERVLLPATAVLRRDLPIRLIVAPHEPTASHLEALERRLDRHALRHARLGAIMAAGGALPEVVVVDRLGVLADLYAAGDVAYVGGGFRGAGLHSVVEPAALARPVLFGPGHTNAREAGALADAGGGFVVSGAGEVESTLRRLAGDRVALEAAGEAAVELVRAGTGAGARNAKLIARAVTGTIG